MEKAAAQQGDPPGEEARRVRSAALLASLNFDSIFSRSQFEMRYLGAVWISTRERFRKTGVKRRRATNG
jgi:hypothetical protein